VAERRHLYAESLQRFEDRAIISELVSFAVNRCSKHAFVFLAQTAVGSDRTIKRSRKMGAHE